MTDLGGRPHRVSRLLVAGGARRAMIRTLVRPRAIPSDLPPTAPMRPPDYSAISRVLPRAAHIEEGFAEWYTLAEKGVHPPARTGGLRGRRLLRAGAPGHFPVGAC